MNVFDDVEAYEIYDCAQVMLEKNFNSNNLYLYDELNKKIVDTIIITNIVLNFKITDEDKKMIFKAFNDTLSETQISKIFLTNKEILKNIFDAAKELNKLIEQDDYYSRFRLDDFELEDAAYTKERIDELEDFLEEETQKVIETKSLQKQHNQKERKHDIIDF